MISKIIGSIMIIVSVIILSVLIFQVISANWHYQNDYLNYWQLADKASTISQKSEYIDKFVGALEKSGLQGQNANLIWQTNNSSFDQNMLALKSLQTRLTEIKKMDESSFAYQTAIQQITEQEQGQAEEMLGVLESCWLKVHYIYLWSLWGYLSFIGSSLLGIIGLFIITKDSSVFGYKEFKIK